MTNEIKGVVYNYHIKSVIKRSKQNKKTVNPGGFPSNITLRYVCFLCLPYYRRDKDIPTRVIS